jgi:predicted nucleotidyltransferase
VEEYLGFRHGLENLKEPYRRLVAVLVESLLDVLGSRLVSVVVYGSVARGEAGRDSDIDLLVVAEGLPRSKLRRQEVFEEAEARISEMIEEVWEKGYHVDFSPIILTPEEARRHRPIYLDMIYDAVIIYDRGGFMEKVFMEMAERLRRLGARRVRVGRKWYLVLKDKYRPGEVIEI